MDSTSVTIGPRFVKQNAAGLRPFQSETLRAVKDCLHKLIFVEAPVGAGKSFVFKLIAEEPAFQNIPVILTYPTKILLDTQVESLKKHFNNSAVWPDDSDIFPIDSKNAINILKYSTDSLVQYIKESPERFEAFKNKGELLRSGLFALTYGKRQLFVTTPDVLWLIYSMKYRGAKILQAQLNSALVFFDEFHTYANLYNFYGLLDNLLFKSKVNKIVLLSATPYLKQEAWSEFEKKVNQKQIPVRHVDFGKSEADNDGAVFNFPLHLNLRNFKYTDRHLLLKNISEILDCIQTPAAIIFDSIFRLKHLKKEIEKAHSGFVFREWSGMQKDTDIPDLIERQAKVIVLGTSAIEVGVNMKFRSLITESSTWASAIQRIGRVGRIPYLPDGGIMANAGHVYLFINSRDTMLSLKNAQELSRNEFESILQDTLRDSVGGMSGGELFRGDSYQFIIIDSYLERPLIYSQTLFSMYEIDESRIMEFYGTESEKIDIIKRTGVTDKGVIEEIILRDRLVPIWGIIKSDGLRQTYDRITDTHKSGDPEEVTIFTESNPAGFRFRRSGLKSSNTYPEDSLW